jgi:hypothetical protein
MKRSTLLFIISLFLLNNNCGQDIYNSDANNFIQTNAMSSLSNMRGSGIALKKKLSSSDSGKLHLYGKAGLIAGFTSPIFIDSKSFNGGLTSFTLSTHSGNHHFEANAGTYIVSETSNPNKVDGHFRIGPTQITLLPLLNFVYKYQIPESSIAFKVKVSALGVGFGIGCTI